MRKLSLLVAIVAMLFAGLLTGCGGGSSTTSTPISTERIALMQGNVEVTQVASGIAFGINVVTATRGGIDVNPDSIHFYQNGAEVTPRRAEGTGKSGEIYILDKAGAYGVTCSYAIGSETNRASLQFEVVNGIIRPNITLETVKTADPDMFFTVTTMLTNNSDQALPWVVLKSQLIGQRLTFSTDGAIPSVFDIPAGWEIRPGSTWMMTSDPAYKGWVWTTSLSSVNMGNVPAKGWAKLKFKLSPVTTATVTVYAVNADGSLGAELTNTVTGYRYPVDGQKYKVVTHMAGKADSDIVCSLGNRYNSDFPVRTTAWLSGSIFWCIGPGCNEIMVNVYDKATMTKLEECWFPVMVPTPDDGGGLG